MSNIYSDISIKNQEKENRLKRIKEAKDLDIQWSHQIVQANRENEEIRKQQEEYKGAVEQYKNILQMIEELKRNKELFIKKQAESEIENEKEKQRQYEEMMRMQEKKRQFDIFLKQKGIEASNYIKDMHEEKNRQHEELHRCEKKKQTKFEENLKTKKIIDNYLIKKEKEIMEEKINASNPGTMDVLYTITNPFHNNGNKIDYSTTRFHNVTIERHDNNLPNTLDLKINAYEKAKVEAENTKKILNDKNNKLKEFKKNEKMNFREQIIKKRAKEGMEKLNNEIKDLNKMKKGDKNKPLKRIDINANINNAKQNEKKAEYILNKLLEKQNGNRGKIYGDKNNLQIITNNENEINSKKISDDSLTNFYKDKNDVYEDINNNEVFNKINLDEDDEKMSCSKNKNIKKYEEPIIRDRRPKNEVINRLSPVDLPSYQKVELQEKNEYEHRVPLVKNQVFILNKKQSQNNTKYYLEDIPKKTNDFNLLNELQINSNNNNNNEVMNNNEMNDVKMFINQINSTNLNNNENMPNTFISNQNMNYNLNKLNQDMFANNNKNNNYVMNEDKLKEEKKEKKEDKDKKWKYNKQELYERKKKMLKDKSNFK